MNAIGIVLANSNPPAIRELTKRRIVAALPMFGIYRVIDFSLTNMSHAGIEKVAVMAQYNTKSLDEHLSSQKWWNFGSKRGGLFVYHPFTRPEEPNFYKGDLDAIAKNIHFLRGSHEPYVVITSGSAVCRMDYEKILEYHIDRHADITLVTADIRPWENSDRFMKAVTDENGRVTAYGREPVNGASAKADAGTYIIRRRVLIDFLEKASEENRIDVSKDLIASAYKTKKIFAYHLDSYYSDITTKESYYKTNMDFLNEKIHGDFFQNHDRILTRINDLPPAKLNHGAVVKNSLLAPGTIINGNVENSIISKKSYIGKNCIVKNAIILYDVYVDDGCRVENCILESYNTIEENSEYISNDENEIAIIRENSNRFLI